jgi:hypothetical protein
LRRTGTDFSAVPDVDYSALKILIEGDQKLRECGIVRWFVALNPGALRMIQRSALGEMPGRARLLFDLQSIGARKRALIGLVCGMFVSVKRIEAAGYSSRQRVQIDSHQRQLPENITLSRRKTRSMRSGVNPGNAVPA